MARVEINDATVHEKNLEYVDKQRKIQRTTLFQQEAWIFLSDNKYPLKIFINVDSHDAGYAPGMYGCDIEACINVNQYGRVEFQDRKMVLTPLKSAPAQQPARAPVAASA